MLSPTVSSLGGRAPGAAAAAAAAAAATGAAATIGQAARLCCSLIDTQTLRGPMQAVQDARVPGQARAGG